jgi:glycosyltransferase involved in cell wall biosynthesis
MAKVSVIVPCYNQGAFLEECLQSVECQSYHDWECIIIDDGSTDDSGAIIENFIKDRIRFKLIKQSNAGVSTARNNAIKASNGVFILPLDADDKLSPNYLEVCVNILEELPGISLVYGKVKKFGDNNGFWNLQPYCFEKLLEENMIHCSAMYLKTEWEKTGGYDAQLKVGLEDWEFWVNLLDKNSKVIYSKDCILHYRTKKKSRNNSFTERERHKIKVYIGKKHLGKYYSLISNLPDYIAMNRKEIKRLTILSKSKKNALSVLITFLNVFKKS